MTERRKATEAQMQEVRKGREESKALYEKQLAILEKGRIYAQVPVDATLTDFALLESTNTLHIITIAMLKSLEKRGNITAYDIIKGKNNGLVTLDDLKQELALVLIENMGNWKATVNNNKVVLSFSDEEIEKTFYRTVSKTMYAQKVKHDRKKAYIELDEEIISTDNVQALASHTCIDDVISKTDLTMFLAYVETEKPKKAELYKHFIHARLNGLTIRETARALEIKETTAFDCSKQLKSLWKNFHK